MSSLKTLKETLQACQSEGLFTTDEVEMYFQNKLGDLGLTGVQEEVEGKGEDETTYYDLVFKSGDVVTLAFLEGGDGELPIAAVLIDDREIEISMQDAQVSETGEIDVRQLPIQQIRDIIASNLKNESKEFKDGMYEVFRWVIRGGERVKKRVVRKKRKRLSAKQKAALRKARRFANKPSAMRHRKMSLRKRRTFRLKAGKNRRGSIQFKLAS